MPAGPLGLSSLPPPAGRLRPPRPARLPCVSQFISVSQGGAKPVGSPSRFHPPGGAPSGQQGSRTHLARQRWPASCRAVEESPEGGGDCAQGGRWPRAGQTLQSRSRGEAAAELRAPERLSPDGRPLRGRKRNPDGGSRHVSVASGPLEPNPSQAGSPSGTVHHRPPSGFLLRAAQQEGTEPRGRGCMRTEGKGPSCLLPFPPAAGPPPLPRAGTRLGPAA